MAATSPIRIHFSFTEVKSKILEFNLIMWWSSRDQGASWLWYLVNYFIWFKIFDADSDEIICIWKHYGYRVSIIQSVQCCTNPKSGTWHIFQGQTIETGLSNEVTVSQMELAETAIFSGFVGWTWDFTGHRILQAAACRWKYLWFRKVQCRTCSAYLECIKWPLNESNVYIFVYFPTISCLLNISISGLENNLEIILIWDYI